MKRIIFFSLFVFLIIVMSNLSISLFTLWSKKDLLTRTQQELEKKQKEHRQLEKDLQTVSSSSFIEKEARDKLFLGKPGDVILLIPTASPSAGQMDSNVGKPIWLTWWELFFSN